LFVVEIGKKNKKNTYFQVTQDYKKATPQYTNNEMGRVDDETYTLPRSF
jgi:hypothetical protein